MKFTCSKCAAVVQPDQQFCHECGKRLLMKTNQKLALMEEQMEAARRANWESYRASRGVIKAVQILSPASACDRCKGESGKTIDLDGPMPLPHGECDCYPWCKCAFIPVTAWSPRAGSDS